MSLLRGWLKPDYSKPEERFIDPDGAPYDDHPEGERSIRRALKTPAFKASAIAGIFIAASAALCLTQTGRQGLLLTLFACNCFNAVMLKRDYAQKRQQEYPSLRNAVVIDKAGRIPNDPKVLRALDDDYRREVQSAPRFAVAVPTIFSGVLAGCYYVDGPPVLANAGVAVAIAVIASVPFGARFAWSAYARHQLAEGRWTVTAQPPRLKEEAKEPAQLGLRSVLAPVRIRRALASNAL